jgi:pimeloyl-ACP methyl ester carboxylesterase
MVLNYLRVHPASVKRFVLIGPGHAVLFGSFGTPGHQCTSANRRDENQQGDAFSHIKFSV